MFLLKTAWDNIFFHKKRSFLSILLIVVASSTILLYKGYVEYCEQGMALGFISSCGHIEVAKKDFWNKNTSENTTINGKAILELQEYFSKIAKVKRTDAVLNFQGIMGTEEASKIFWGKAYDDPQSLGVTVGEPLFAEDASIIVGEGLFNALNLDLENNNQVNLMTSLFGNDISTGTFELSGYINTGVPQNDEGCVIASRTALLEYFEIDDMASYIRIYLENDKDTEEVQKMINSYFNENNLPYESMDWKTLNPTWKQIQGHFNIQFSVISVILCILIFVSLTQSICASFMERIGEFGTMEAIGLKKAQLIMSLVLEISIIAIIGIIGAIILSHFGNVFTETFNITMVPPGYSEGYRLNFFITWHSVIITQSFIFFTCLIAVMYPIYTIKNLTTIHLMHYSGV